ncbi:hypothetical protein XbC2_367 [Xanthomonas phage XbC2]|nr:hypothetical protein XbC2_367 [Xanthomonas phage XbC2]
MLSKYLENNECVSTHSDISVNPDVGLFSYEITLNGENKILNINNGILMPILSHAALSGDDFSLKMSESGLRFWLRDDTVARKIFDTNITEEWFFQLSTIHDFGSLRYSDIEFVIDVFKNLCTGE